MLGYACVRELPTYTHIYTHTQVKLAGTARIWVEEMSGTKAIVTLKNRRRVQNHIGGIHACGMALAAESATGIVVGMYVCVCLCVCFCESRRKK